MADLPEVDELVLATVKKIMPYGAFCSLDEYGGRESFLHISEVAPRWIKNIHEFLHEGQSLVAKVHNVMADKAQVDISIKRVSDSERKAKIESVRHSKRADKLFEIAKRQAKSTTDEAQSAKGQLAAKYGDMLNAFEQISTQGEAALAGMKIEKGLLKAILEVAQKSIKKAKAEVRAQVQLTSYSENGVEDIRAAFKNFEVPQGAVLKIQYLGAPRYQIVLTCDGEYKEANRMLGTLKDSIEKYAKEKSLEFLWSEEGEGKEEAG
jgi:translation initiation factor 2 subunit 1